MEPEITWLSGGISAAAEVAIATAMGLAAVVVCYPVLLLSKAVKIPVLAWKTRAAVRASADAQAR